MNYAITDLLPDDPNVIVGHNLHMTCQLYSDDYHARDLKFEFRLHRTDGHRRGHVRKIQASASDIFVVNASVVELNYTNMRPRFDRATVVCYHQKSSTALSDMQIIKVGREYSFYLEYL